jgi:hypothetical protein
LVKKVENRFLTITALNTVFSLCALFQLSIFVILITGNFSPFASGTSNGSSSA